MMLALLMAVTELALRRSRHMDQATPPRHPGAHVHHL
jgi:hypothetical protein